MTTKTVLSITRDRMMKGEVAEAAELLAHLWLTLRIDQVSGDVAVLHNTSLELADRFPAEEPVSGLLYSATAAYVRAGDLLSATGMATRMVSVWRARCQADPNEEALVKHAHALDTLAGVYRERGMPDAITGCLVELVEWHFACGNQVGVAWAVREMGALAFSAGDLDNAVVKFAWADELYGEDSEDISVAGERAECHVLLGRVSHVRGDLDSARRWYTQALRYLPDAAAREVRELIRAVGAGVRAPEPVELRICEFGRPVWMAASE